MKPASCVYFIQQGDDGPIKIGTTINLYKRLASLQKEYQDAPLHMIAIIDGDRETERALHSRFGHMRLNGEWFDPTCELKDYIRDHAEPVSIRYTPSSPRTIDLEATYIGRLVNEKGWDIRDFAYHARISESICYQATKPDWPQNGTNWKTIKRIANALGVSPSEITSKNENN